jgi:glycosyltransferase involved in cell wall biosynthesis
MSTPVSFVVPVFNGVRHLQEVLAAVFAQGDGRPLEVIAVDDGSTDGSAELLQALEREGRLRLIAGPRQGAAAAINQGVAAAQHAVICQVDQDVVVGAGWMQRLVSALDADARLGAAQGYYATDPRDGPWARAAGYDLELRYARLSAAELDHVCTGNTAYRREALQAVGGLDPTFGYGYDNDLSYRLAQRGYRLAFCREARSVHRWRRDAFGYLRQQYGQGYGRLDVVARHPRKLAGDQVSDWRMIARVPVTLAVLALGVAAAAAAELGGPARALLFAASAGAAVLLAERTISAVAAARRFRDPGALVLVPAGALRDLAWAWACVRWSWHRLRGLSRNPHRSM